VLVLLVVVLVPMFLEREPRQQKQDIDIRIPPIPGQAQQPPSPTPAQSPSPPAPSTAPPAALPPPSPGAPASTPAAIEPMEAKSPSAEAERAAPQVSPAQAAAASPPHARSEEGYVIQLGAYSNASNAKQLLKQLKAHKFPAYSESVKTSSGERTRVRVGPYPSVDGAEKARERLKALKLIPVSDAKVVPMGE